MTRTQFFLPILFLSACAGSPDSDPGGDTAAHTDELWSGAGQPLWPSGRIPVCWEIGLDENGGGSPTPARNDPDFTRVVQITRDAVNNGWARQANITFSGWGDCPSTDTRQFPNTLSIHLSGWGGWSEFGPIGSRATRMRLSSNDLRVNGEAVFRSIVLHEFGHALGFAHEFDRKDNPTPAGQDCAGGSGPVNFNGWTTPFDRDSIMNWSYCGFNGSPPNPGVLSRWDIVGVQKAYGFKPAGSLVGEGNRCVDIPLPQNTIGIGDLSIYGCHGGSNQSFVWDRITSKLFAPWYIFGPFVGDTAIANILSSPNVKYSPRSTNTNDPQQFVSFSNVMIKGLGDKCLDVVWGDFRPGNGVWMWNCHGGAAQRWQVFKSYLWTSSEVQIQLAWNPGVNQSLCLDVPNANFYEGAPLQIWSCNGSVAQRFTITNNGELMIGGYCVDVRGYSVNDGAIAQLYRCHGQSNQKWHFTGPVSMNGECLDAGLPVGQLGTGNTWGRPLLAQSCNGSRVQEFDYYFRN